MTASLLAFVFFGLIVPFLLLLTFFHVANTPGIGSWAQALSQAQAMVGNMTMDEKVNQTTKPQCGDFWVNWLLSSSNRSVSRQEAHPRRAAWVG